MQQPQDYELFKGSGDDLGPPSPGHRQAKTWVIAAVVVLAIAAAGYFWYRTRGGTPEPGAEEPSGVKVATDSVSPLGGEPMPGDVPPLDESDPFVRELIRHLSSHPRIAAWLATDGLIRNFTVAVSNIAEGQTPAQHLKVLRPSSDFRVTETDEDLFIDPRSYARYDDLAEAVSSVNASGTAEIYATLKPRIEEAHRELGAPEGTFDRTLERAIVLLLQTPVSDAPVRLRPIGIGYGFADDRLEKLTGAQKQLLRMGPRNARAVQAKLREIALELGIPADRLPPEQ